MHSLQRARAERAKIEQRRRKELLPDYSIPLGNAILTKNHHAKYIIFIRRKKNVCI